MDQKQQIIKNELPETSLTRQDFYYELPPALIAQKPSPVRDRSRLMVVDRHDGSITHRVFHDIIEYLHPGDVLVINDSKVIPARLYGIKESNSIPIEVLLLRQRGRDVWETIMRPGKRAKVGTTIVFGDGLLRAEVTEILEDGGRLVRFAYEGDNIYSILDRVGNTPLPPYITERLTDSSRYQTVYARKEGSAAAPTAGLHFTTDLLEEIKAKGIQIAPVMLHVGLGTFRPVKEEHLADHIMHTEYFEVSRESADIINGRTGRLIAVGTTSCRTLESAADEQGNIHPMAGDTGIFIYPGYQFRAVDALITNFHLPESTLLMLVSAFSSRELMMHAYETAVAEQYRFFSFGDAMFIR